MSKKCKCKKEPEGPSVPEWVVTYGDMMSLLLCFFILLAAFSELKKEHEYQQVVEAVKEAFGYKGGDGVVPSPFPPTRSMLKTLESISLESRMKTRVSQNPTPGMTGKHATVKRIREGLLFTIGGSSAFLRESAELNDQTKDALRELARLFEGRNNKIIVRGHADSKTLSPGSQWTDLYELSFARAHNVERFLTLEMGLDPKLFRIEACGDTEPIQPRFGAVIEQRVNRRVEIILTETLASDFNPDADFTDPDNARGG
ncbi:MAG: flagellar motor protein MotB [Phycisphaerales bacterium]